MLKRWSMVFLSGLVAITAANADEPTTAVPAAASGVKETPQFCHENPGPSLVTLFVPSHVAGEVKVTFRQGFRNAQGLEGSLKIWLSETLSDMQWSHCARDQREPWTVPIRALNVERQLDLYVSEFPVPNGPGRVACKVLPVNERPLRYRRS